MCGIFGYVGGKRAENVVIEGLKKLEYRGYDSAGIAGVKEGKLFFCKEEGKIPKLEAELKGLHFDLRTAIGHTRWATHGKPSKINAHPQFDQAHTLAIVHNGIIENYEALKQELSLQGSIFESQTDTEVVAHLIASLYKGDLMSAVRAAISRLSGSYAIALVHRDYPNQIIAIAHKSPLALGIGEQEMFLSSDSHAFASFTSDVIFLHNNEIALVRPGHIEIFDQSHQPIEKEKERLEVKEIEVSKGDFEHFTLKEIFEQPKVLENALKGRLDEEYGSVYFEELNGTLDEIASAKRILILGCGSSWNAGCLGAYMFEEIARIPTTVEISSEFRYKNPIVPEGTLVIAISQSGETADTLGAIRELKAKHTKVISLCNVHASSLARESDSTIFLRAGKEMGVCSTKGVTNQVALLFLLAVLIGRKGDLSRLVGPEFLKALKQLPSQIEEVLSQSHKIEKIAKEYAHYENFFYIGRRYMYPTSLEGALKLKEISYINANGYPAGEMKHGPIALINEACPTFALCADKATFPKMVSNIMEIRARGGKVIALTDQQGPSLEKMANDVIVVPQVIDELSAIPTLVALQLFAYFVAKERGKEIDHPRNLAKSVTVE
jgi:glucosamine--fructose-6-phosphate aminotransferase (isomerizing)